MYSDLEDGQLESPSESSLSSFSSSAPPDSPFTTTATRPDEKGSSHQETGGSGGKRRGGRSRGALLNIAENSSDPQSKEMGGSQDNLKMSSSRRKMMLREVVVSPPTTSASPGSSKPLFDNSSLRHQPHHHQPDDASSSSSKYPPSGGSKMTGPPSQLATAPTSPPAGQIEVAVVILFYAGVSLAIVYFNWWLFTASFKFPVFVSWFQQLFGALMFLFFASLGRFFPIFSHFPCVVPNFRTAVRVLPLAVNFVLMVAFANICLKYVQVSTYQVARSLTILFTILLSYGLLGQVQSRGVVGACGVMVLGFIVGSLDPSTLSLGGVITGACSSVFQAMYNVVIKTTLIHVDNNTNVMLFYTQLISALLFLPVIFIAGEAPGVREQLPLGPSDPHFYSIWLSLCLSGLLAGLMNLAAYLCVKMTSPLTFNIVGFTKSLVQSLGGVVFLGDVVSPQSLGGILFSLFGSAWYSRIKIKESKSAAAAVDNKKTGGITSERNGSMLEMELGRSSGSPDVPDDIRILLTPTVSPDIAVSPARLSDEEHTSLVQHQPPPAHDSLVATRIGKRDL